MKPHLHIVPREADCDYLARHHSLPNFGTIWHYHPELELHYIVKGQGVRFIGDNVNNFNEGELLLIGVNLPHMWRCNESYFIRNSELIAEAVVVQFLPNFMGNDFLKKAESESIIKLYNRAKNGLIINGETKEKIISLMYKSVKKDSLSRLILILRMIKILSKSEEMYPICSSHNFYQTNSEEEVRINKVFSYTLENYKKDISLEEIASIASLSSTSFCRYFKEKTNKTFRKFLIEIRINHAKRMLIEEKWKTTDAICFDCGFNNRSNFFHNFKSITTYTPIEYKKKFS
jgi:AraC-like DNA-binding protein